MFFFLFYLNAVVTTAGVTSTSSCVHNVRPKHFCLVFHWLLPYALWGEIRNTNVKLLFFFILDLTLQLKWIFSTLWKILHLNQVEVNQQVTYYLFVTAFRHFIFLETLLGCVFSGSSRECVSVPPKLLHLCWIWLVLRVGVVFALSAEADRVSSHCVGKSQQQTSPAPVQKENA